ncbi:MAG: hypothetical protein WCP70_01550 [Methanothrix sp.]
MRSPDTGIVSWPFGILIFTTVAFALTHNIASHDKDLNGILATHTPHQAQS